MHALPQFIFRDNDRSRVGKRRRTMAFCDIELGLPLIRFVVMKRHSRNVKNISRIVELVVPGALKL